MWYDNILGTIGNTPLVRLNRVAGKSPCPLLAKVEFFNPGGSVKDRIGVAMLDAAERDGRIKPGGTVIECTSGNTGAGLAIAAIARGYRTIFTTTDKQSKEKVDVLRAMGAEVVVCPTNVHPDDPKSYYSVARRLASEIPNSVHINQYDNPANEEAHYRTTGPELWVQTEGRITHFFCGAGTGGTISGTTRYLKEQNSVIKTVGIDPYGSVYYTYWHTREFDDTEIYPYITEGVGEDILAGNMNFDRVDDYVRVSDRDAMQMTRRLAREEGLFVGGSSGMAVAGAIEWLEAHADSVSEEDVAVVLLPDGGFRYLSKIFDDAWMQNLGFLETAPSLTVVDVLRFRSPEPRPVVYAEPGELLADAVAKMSEHDISQIPVIEGTDVVGTITESGILGTLIREPAAREQPVREVMTPPLPLVPGSLHVDHLSNILDKDVGAVLVRGTDADDTIEILTKSDLISALVDLGHPSRH
jgi:cystathionine beta-synthase